jgi:hypothetical protein
MTTVPEFKSLITCVSAIPSIPGIFRSVISRSKGNSLALSRALAILGSHNLVSVLKCQQGAEQDKEHTLIVVYNEDSMLTHPGFSSQSLTWADGAQTIQCAGPTT